MSFDETKKVQVKLEQILPKDYAEGLAKHLVNKKYFLKRVDVKKVEKAVVDFDNFNEIWHARTR